MNWKPFLCRSLSRSIRQYCLRKLLGLCSLGWDEASSRRQYPPRTRAFLLYVGIPSFGWMLVVTSRVVATKHSSMSADCRSKSIEVVCRITRETAHAVTG